MIGHTNRYAMISTEVADTSSDFVIRRRVKAVDTLKVSLPNQATTTLVATISSDGKARVYDLAQVPKPATKSEVATIEPVGEYDSDGSRLVCLALVDSDEVEEGGLVVGKRKRGEDDQEEDEGGEANSPGVLGEKDGVQEEEARSEEGGSDDDDE